MITRCSPLTCFLCCRSPSQGTLSAQTRNVRCERWAVFAVPLDRSVFRRARWNLALCCEGRVAQVPSPLTAHALTPPARPPVLGSVRGRRPAQVHRLPSPIPCFHGVSSGLRYEPPPHGVPAASSAQCSDAQCSDVPPRPAARKLGRDLTTRVRRGPRCHTTTAGGTFLGTRPRR